ncbi:MAG: hypothetical protein K2L77_07970 [Muribaculaceae bacterium]|nr:hypothetical protein [Muribaculaceae bacterium]
MYRQLQYRLCRGYRPATLDRQFVEVYPGMYSDGDIYITASSAHEAYCLYIADMLRPPPCAAALYYCCNIETTTHRTTRQPSLAQTSPTDPPHL